ncbi:MAG TPA: hypothetical protein VGM10_20955 [Actinocrinis sp.]|jgi:hypothetical protein
MSPADLLLRVPDPADCQALGFHLERLLALDKAAAVRIVGVGPVAAVYSAPPLHGSTSKGSAVAVLAVRTLALAAGSEPFDRTVAAGRLLDALAKLEKHERPDANGSGGRLVPVPEPLVGGPSWAGLLPPRSGWRPADPIPVVQLAEAVAQGNSDFRFAALGRDRAGLDSLAEEIWTRELPGGLRWRSAHAASAMGFLGPDPARSDALARLAAHSRWLRLDAPYGTVLERTAGLE